MEQGYRVPKLEEFVQGFEFEVANIIGIMLLDFSGKQQDQIYPYKKIWSKSKVTWKGDSSEIITEKFLDDSGQECKLMYKGAFRNLFQPFDEQSYIDQELVRVKI